MMVVKWKRKNRRFFRFHFTTIMENWIYPFRERFGATHKNKLNQEDEATIMDFSPPFFDLQLRFAERVTHTCSLSFEEALLNYTNFYLQFINRSFDPAHPIWQQYLAGLRNAQDPAQWTCMFYQTRRKDI